MFPWNTKRMVETELKRLTLAKDEFVGASRRAINLVPAQTEEDNQEFAITSGVRFHPFLVSIEGKQRTCCFKIVSPGRKSRAAILIFRGRVVGCVYGCKSLDKQYFGQRALDFALGDLAYPGNALSAYGLTEELVLASASLFNGEILDFDMSGGHAKAFTDAIAKIKELNAPGCAVIQNPAENLVYMAYVVNGTTCGLYSNREGWLKDGENLNLDKVEFAQDTHVLASILQTKTPEEAYQQGLSLTGLNDKERKPQMQPSKQLHDAQLHQLVAIDYYPAESQVWHARRQFGMSRLPWARVQNKEFKSQHSHMINP
jgi:hypothetical protein